MGDFAWPLAAVVLGVIFMLIFRQPISMFIAKLRRVSRDGLETSSDQPQKVPERDPSPKHVEKLMKSFDSLILRNQEASIQEELKNQSLSGEEEVKVLTRHLAANQIALYHEQLNASLWGSQISLLKFLNSSVEGETSEVLRHFYDSGAVNYPDVYSQYSFESYMHYLIDTGIIIEQQEKYLITELGRDFLVYIARVGISESRPY